MAKPLHFSELERLGFKPNGVEFSNSGRGGEVTSRRWSTSRNSDARGNMVRPTDHHVIIDEYANKPGKYNVSYHVAQDGQLHPEGSFQREFRHEENDPGGFSDPIKSVMSHHNKTVRSLNENGEPTSFSPVTPGNVHELASSTHQWGDPGLVSYNSAPVNSPLHVETARMLKNAGFTHFGRFPGDDGTDVYHSTIPLSKTFEVRFTVNHRPSSRLPYSYSAKRAQSGVDDDGNEDRGSSIDVTGDTEPIARLGTIHDLIQRHADVEDALGISKTRKHSFVDNEFSSIVARLMDQADEDLRP